MDTFTARRALIGAAPIRSAARGGRDKLASGSQSLKLVGGCLFGECRWRLSLPFSCRRRTDEESRLGVTPQERKIVMMRGPQRWPLPGFLVLLLATPGWAVNYYVSPSGRDGNPGTLTMAWVNRGSYVDVRGFDVSGNGAGGILNLGSNVSIARNHAHDIPAPGCTSNGGAGIDTGEFTAVKTDITRNLVHDIGDFEEGCRFVHGIHHAHEGGRIVNNIVLPVSGWGVHLWHAPSTSRSRTTSCSTTRTEASSWVPGIAPISSIQTSQQIMSP